MLGAGGYVAGPMVLAARLRGIPAALTEADAHLGLANRLAAPFARRVFLAYAIAGRDGAKYRVVGPPDPAAHLGGRSRRRHAARFGLPADGPVLAVFGGLAGAQALNEFAAETYGERGPAILHIAGERDYEARAPQVCAARLRPAPDDRSLRRRARSRRPRALARRRDGLGARRRRDARRSSSRIRTRPPTTSG